MLNRREDPMMIAQSGVDIEKNAKDYRDGWQKFAGGIAQHTGKEQRKK